MADQFLSMRNISKRYVGVQALDSVDFDVYRGEIHCLVGENGSGKSTLIKIISGVVQPDDGAKIEIDGREIQDYGAIDAIHRGIEVIYQDLSLFPNLTVAENIALSRTIAKKRTFINWSSVRRVAKDAMDRIGVSLPLEENVEDISLADQQLVAICRALTHGVKLVIMDEPTTALTKKEVEALFSVVEDMQTKGIATMFVSHKLGEVFQIAERVTVLRDGQKVGTYARQDLDDEKLTMLMTGQKLGYERYRSQEQNGDLLLEVRDLARRGSFRDISLRLRRGDILGITGLLGSGRTELALALFGLQPADSGEILIEGKTVRIRSPQDAKALGIGYVPENRLVQGLIMQQPVSKNIVITILDRLLNRLGLIDLRQTQARAEQGIQDLAIRVPSAEAPAETLSGGNQQRVVLAKWIATEPRILILDGPTVGIDVAAKSAIHNIVRELAREGVGIILISDEISEVYHNCNRVLVMHKGRLLAEFDPAQADEEEIQACISSAG